MLLRYFYDEKLAHASYMVGCQQKKKAIIVDPMRNIEPYIQAAKKEDMKIMGALETHIHADFVAGSRELADRFGSTMYLSGEGDKNWRYQNLNDFKHVLLKDGDKFELGRLIFEVMHTPGHTPESISFLLTDGTVADEPIGIFTGDFVFAGDIGRPDLIEKVAGIKGTTEAGAKLMYHSLERFKQLPDYLQVWPAHGAGSACGKSLGAVPSTTVGYEKKFNWAMKFDNEVDFMKALLDGQPEPPYYFAVMKSVNKSGTKLIEHLPELQFITSIVEVERLITAGHQVIDTRDVQSFSKWHIKGTINVPFNNSFTNWMGWITDYKKPVYLLTNPTDIEEVLIALRSIGIDQVLGYADTEVMIEQADVLDSYENVSPTEAKSIMDTEDMIVLDVRNLTEFNEGHIEGAKHIMVGTLKNRLDEVPNKKLIVQCQAGSRSAIAASILKANGFHNLVNMTGGYGRWIKEVE